MSRIKCASRHCYFYLIRSGSTLVNSLMQFRCWRRDFWKVGNITFRPRASSVSLTSASRRRLLSPEVRKIRFADPHSGQRLISCDADVTRKFGVAACGSQTIEPAIRHTRQTAEQETSFPRVLLSLSVNFRNIRLSKKETRVNYKKEKKHQSKHFNIELNSTRELYIAN